MKEIYLKHPDGNIELLGFDNISDYDKGYAKFSKGIIIDESNNILFNYTDYDRTTKTLCRDSKRLCR